MNLCSYLSLFCLASLPIIAAEAEVKSTPQQLFQRGVEHFMAARITESVAAFDALIAAQPEARPQLWQRGLALYYAGKYAEGRKQFETHQTVNTADVENAAWHFICVARQESVEAARKHFIPIEGDSRVPMREVHQLFAGKGSEAEVLAAAEVGSDDESKRRHRCYAHLYLGLYYEALGDNAKAKDHILKSAIDYAIPEYMGEVSRVHMKVRGWTADTKKK